MPTLYKQKIHVAVEELVQLVNQLETSDLQHLITQSMEVLAKRVNRTTQKEEGTLVQQALLNFTDKEQQRYDLLMKLLNDEVISFAQKQELDALVEKSEQLNLQRMTALAQLSKIRGVSIVELMKELNIYPNIHE